MPIILVLKHDRVFSKFDHIRDKISNITQMPVTTPPILLKFNLKPIGHYVKRITSIHIRNCKDYTKIYSFAKIKKTHTWKRSVQKCLTKAFKKLRRWNFRFRSFINIPKKRSVMQLNFFFFSGTVIMEFRLSGA